jgi:hypothetical protein
METAMPEPDTDTRVSIEGPAGALEVVVETPAAPPAGAAVICHPHPRHGGTLDNKVVFTLARAAREAGLAAVRFNFRGVGASAGVYDEGRGELDDCRAVIAWAQAQVSGVPILAGFSFGAGIALQAAATGSARGLATVALPVSYFPDLPRPACPWLAVHGDADDVADCDEALRRLQALDAPPEIEILAGAGHFFHGRLSDLRAAVTPKFAAWATNK